MTPRQVQRYLRPRGSRWERYRESGGWLGRTVGGLLAGVFYLAVAGFYLWLLRPFGLPDTSDPAKIISSVVLQYSVPGVFAVGGVMTIWRTITNEFLPPKAPTRVFQTGALRLLGATVLVVFWLLLAWVVVGDFGAEVLANPEEKLRDPLILMVLFITAAATLGSLVNLWAAITARPKRAEPL
jgi:hypothetical protein